MLFVIYKRKICVMNSTQKRIAFTVLLLLMLLLHSCKTVTMTVTERAILFHGKYRVCGTVKGYDSKKCAVIKSWKKFDRAGRGFDIKVKLKK